MTRYLIILSSELTVYQLKVLSATSTGPVQLLSDVDKLSDVVALRPSEVSTDLIIIIIIIISDESDLQRG